MIVFNGSVGKFFFDPSGGTAGIIVILSSLVKIFLS